MRKINKPIIIDILIGLLLAVVAVLVLNSFAYNIAILIIVLTAIGLGVIRGGDNSLNVLEQSLLINIFFIPFLLLAMNVWHLIFIPLASLGGISLGLYIKAQWKSSFIKITGVLTLSLFVIFVISLVGIPRLFDMTSTSETHIQMPEYEFLTLEGELIKSSEFKNKVVVLDFWGTWCAPCIKQFPLLEDLKFKYKDDSRIVFIAVNANVGGDTFEKFKSFINKNSYNLFFAYDIEGKTSKKIKIKSFPTLVIIDKKGFLRVKHKGFNSSENFILNISKHIDVLLSKK